MRILVTAVTHDAINHLLLKVQKLMALLGDGDQYATTPVKFATLSDINVGSIVREKRAHGRTGLRVVRLIQGPPARLELADDAEPDAQHMTVSAAGIASSARAASCRASPLTIIRACPACRRRNSSRRRTSRSTTTCCISTRTSAKRTRRSARRCASGS